MKSISEPIYLTVNNIDDFAESLYNNTDVFTSIEKGDDNYILYYGDDNKIGIKIQRSSASIRFGVIYNGSTEHSASFIIDAIINIYIIRTNNTFIISYSSSSNSFHSINTKAIVFTNSENDKNVIITLHDAVNKRISMFYNDTITLVQKTQPFINDTNIIMNSFVPLISFTKSEIINNVYEIVRATQTVYNEFVTINGDEYFLTNFTLVK